MQFDDIDTLAKALTRATRELEDSRTKLAQIKSALVDAEKQVNSAQKNRSDIINRMANLLSANNV